MDEAWFHLNGYVNSEAVECGAARVYMFSIRCTITLEEDRHIA
jgi:hypothetical protein